MAYMHIDNLYKTQDILMLKECYALEKIHGTSAHITYKSGRIGFFAGGGKYETFITLFDEKALKKRFEEIIIGDESVTVYGESYGGKQQGMSAVYGKEGKFVAFEVKIGNLWLAVPKAEKLAIGLGLEFVHYNRIPCTIESIDAERDAPSYQAILNGMGKHPREGIVLRPLEEVTKNNGQRVMAKHKGDAYKETKSSREVSPEKLQIIAEAKAIAEEWVTPMRLKHILSGSGLEIRIENTGKVIALMTEDIIREAEGEIVDSPNARKEIARHTALMFKRQLQSILKEF